MVAVAVVLAVALAGCTTAASPRYVRFRSSDASATECYAACAPKNSLAARRSCYEDCSGTTTALVDECKAQPRPATACERRAGKVRVGQSALAVVLIVVGGLFLLLVTSGPNVH